MVSGRSSYLDRARQCVKLTIPSLLPEDDSGEKGTDTSFKTPFQGTGAEGVSTLAARMLLALFPANAPMFRMQVADMELANAQEAGNKEWETEIQTALSRYEQAVQAEIESSGDRPSMHEAILHLLNAGNVLLFDPPELGQPIRIFPLTRFVVERDPMGRWTEIVIHEKVSLKALPDKMQSAILTATEAEGEVKEDDESYLDLYTHVRRNGDTCTSYQEVAGQKIEGTDGSYPVAGCPWIPLRMYWVAGENYGRSYVESFLGDLKTLEALTQAIIEASAASAKILFLVHPNSTTKANDLAKAPNCGFVTGSAADVDSLQVQKAGDLRVALETMQIIQNRLSKAFLLMDGMRRDAERVTAEEIRAVAAELEAGLGGVYSMLTQEFQLPYVKRKIHKLTKASKLPQLPDKSVQPSIVTGFEALGRGNDRQKLVQFIGTAAQALGPEALMQYLNISDFLQRLAASDGINTSGLIKTPEELQAEQEQAQQQQAMQSLGPEAMKMAGQAMQSGMAAPEQPQPPM